MDRGQQEAERQRNRGFSLLGVVKEIAISGGIGAVAGAAIGFGINYVSSFFGVDLGLTPDRVVAGAAAVIAAANVILNGGRIFGTEERIK